MKRAKKMNLRDKEGLTSFLQKNVGNIAFLRFEVGGLEQGPLSDWDIAVKEPGRALGDCKEIFGDPWLRIPREYVVQHYYDWGQVDLLPSFEWNGYEYLDQEKFWAGVTESPDQIPRPALGHDAYITWMTGLLWGGAFKGRYANFIQAGALKDEVIFKESLREAFGDRLGNQLYELAAGARAGEAVALVSELRKALKWRRLRGDAGPTIKALSQHWLCELKFHLNPPFPWIGVLGPDGSGKSTVIDGLTERLKLSRVGLEAIHWMPQLRKEAERSIAVVTDPHGRPAKSALLSILQLGKIVSVWWISLLKDLIHLRAKKAIVLSDRFYLDLLADPRRYRYGTSTRLAAWAFKLIPKPDKVIILHTDAETILGRKQEVTPDELTRQLGAYQKIAKDWGKRALLVDCGQEPNEVIDKLVGVVLGELKKRSR